MTPDDLLRDLRALAATLEKKSRDSGSRWAPAAQAQAEIDAESIRTILTRYEKPAAPPPDAKDERIRNLEKAFAMAIASRGRLKKQLQDAGLWEKPPAPRDYSLFYSDHDGESSYWHTPDHYPPWHKKSAPPAPPLERWVCKQCGAKVSEPWDGGHLVETCHPTWCGPVERQTP